MKKITTLTLLFSSALAVFGQISVEITSPNGGESFVPGTIINIDYTLTDGLEYDSPEFHYSLDGGATYTFIASIAITPAPPMVHFGSHSWTIPAATSSTCLIATRVHRGGMGYLTTDTSDAVFTIDPATSSSKDIQAESISIFPNPFQSKLNIKLGSIESSSISIYDLTGKIVYRKENINSPKLQIELNAKPGLYFLKIESPNGVINRKIFKE